MRKPKLSSSDRIFFAKRLSFLLRAGIPIRNSIETISQQSKKSLKPIFNEITSCLEKGQSLSFGMKIFPESFTDLMVSMIISGEQSGTLSSHINLLSEELHRRRSISRKLTSSLLYPAIIAIGTIILSVFLVVIIFPKIRKLFQGLKVPLPITTKILIKISEVAQTYGIAIICFLLLISIIIFILIKKYPKIKSMEDRFVLSLPIFGRMIRYYNLSSIFRTIGIMLKSGIPIEKSFQQAGTSVSNSILIETFQSIAKDVSAGNTINSAMKKFPRLFPEFSISMIEIGEYSGTLPETFSYLSEMIDEENENLSKKLLDAIEPALMIAIGLIVGIIALSIITPIYAITQNLN